MRPRWRKVAADLFDNKTRTALVVLSIGLGVFSIGFVAGARGVILRSLDEAYRDVAPASAVLTVAAFDDEIVDLTRAVPGVAAAEGRREEIVRLQTGPESWRDALLYGVSDFRRIELERITRERGAWPPAEGEVLLERASLAHLKKRIGDTISIELADGTRRELPIVGTAHGLNQAPATLSNWVSGYVTIGTLESFGAGSHLNRLYLRVPGSAMTRSEIEAVAAEARLRLEESGRTVLQTKVPTPGRLWAHDAVESLLGLLTLLGLVAVGMSALLVVNTVSSVLSQHVKQIGVMKSIGADAAQLARMYLTLVAGFGVLALLVAVPLALLASIGLVNFMAALINFDSAPFRLEPGVLLLEAGAGLLVPLGAALRPVMAGSRVTVRDAISSYGLGGDFGTGRLDRLLGNVRGLSRPISMSLRNTFRQKGRLALTLTTLTLGCAMFVAALSVRATLFRAADDVFGYNAYDVKVVFDGLYAIDQIERKAAAVPGVTGVESWHSRFVHRRRPGGGESNAIELVAPPAASAFVKPILEHGRWLLPEDENAIVLNGDVLREEPDLRVGDEVRLTVDGEDTAWRVVGLVRGQLGGPIAYVNQEYLAKLVGESGEARNAQVAIADPAAQAEVARQLDAHLKKVGLRPSVVLPIGDVRAAIAGSFGILVAFLIVMAVLLSLVGGLGLMGTMSLNVLERTREIGVMRAIGATDWAIFRVVAAEGVLIGAISWLLGVALAVPLAWLLVGFVASTFLHGPATFVYSVGGALVLLPLVLVLTLVSSFLPSLRASRLTVRDVLAYS